jgi:hypothetical protein
MWNEIRANVVRYAGAAGSVTIPPGGHVLQIIAHSSNALGTVTIFGGTAIPLPNVNSYWTYQPQHLSTTAQATGNTIVFALTQSYFVEVAVPAGA